MLYAILCYHREAVVATWTQEQDEAVMIKHAAIGQQLAAQGKLGPVARLMPTRTAATLRLGRQPLVLDGPFAETKEQLLGFYVVDCASLEEATEVAQPFAQEGGTLEIRPIHTFIPGAFPK